MDVGITDSDRKNLLIESFSLTLGADGFNHEGMIPVL